MGRELRRVPPDWKHPKDERGEYIPMHDKTWLEALAEWEGGKRLWDTGEHPDQKDPAYETEGVSWEEWEGAPPDHGDYRPAFTSEPTAYQVYENVTYGTPVSPVLRTPEAVVRWLSKQGYSRHAAEEFVRVGYAPTGVLGYTAGQLVFHRDIHSLDIPRGGES